VVLNFSTRDFLCSGESGNVEEEVGIEKWDSDTIIQFLDEKIQH